MSKARSHCAAISAKQPPVFDAFNAIDSKHIDCGAAYFSFAVENWAAPTEVIAPPVGARIEQRHKLVRNWIIAGNVRSLRAVTIRARKRKIFEQSRAAMFSRSDMVHFVG